MSVNRSHCHRSDDPDAVARRHPGDRLGIAVHDDIIVGKEGHASFKGLKLM